MERNPGGHWGEILIGAGSAEDPCARVISAWRYTKLLLEMIIENITCSSREC